MASLVNALDELLNRLRGEPAIRADPLRKIEQEGDNRLPLRNHFRQKKDIEIGQGSAALLELLQQEIVHKGTEALPLFRGQRGDQLVLVLGDGRRKVAFMWSWAQELTPLSI